MKKEFRRFYRLAVESFINENLDSSIYNTENLMQMLDEYSKLVIDDVIEFLDEQIYQILQDEFKIEL